MDCAGHARRNFQAALADTKNWFYGGFMDGRRHQSSSTMSGYQGKENIFNLTKKLGVVRLKLRAMHAAHKAPVPSYFTRTTTSGYDLYKNRAMTNSVVLAECDNHSQLLKHLLEDVTRR